MFLLNRNSRETRSLLLWSFGVSFVILLPDFVAPFNHDSELYQSIGWLHSAYGRIPYLGSWDQNFPGIFYLHSFVISLFGVSPFVFRTVDITAHLLTAILVGLLVHRRYGLWTAIGATALCSLDYMFGGYWLAGQRDGFGSLLILLATASYLAAREKYSHRSSGWLLIVSGVFAGFAIAFRPTFGLMGAALGLAIVLYEREKRWQWSALYIAGGVLSWILILFPYLIRPGALTEFYLATVRFNLEVHILYRQSILLLVTRPREIVYDLLLGVWCVQYVRHKGWPNGQKLRLAFKTMHVETMLFIAYYIAAKLSVVLMGKYFISHYDPQTVLNGILGSIVLRSVLLDFRSHPVVRYGYGIAFAFLMVFLYASSMVPALVHNIVTGRGASLHELHAYRHYAVNDWELEYDLAADYLDRHAARGNPIEVWGWSTGLYWRAGCTASSRFVFMLPLIMTQQDGSVTTFQKAWQREFIDSLRHVPPKFIVIAKDSMGLGVFYFHPAAALVDSLPGFRQLLDSIYRLDTVMPHWDVYQRETS
jgi:MFS family permease